MDPQEQIDRLAEQVSDMKVDLDNLTGRVARLEGQPVPAPPDDPHHHHDHEEGM